MTHYPFYALLSRMKYITRWCLMHANRPESLSEHTADTAILAHALCLIAQKHTGARVRPETVAVAALYHDAPEIVTGDMPTPVKYKNERIRQAYKELEKESAADMVRLLPREMQPEMAAYLSGSLLTEKETQLLKAADRLSALIKCIEETQAGNREFEAAEAQQRQGLLDMHCAEADWFMEHMLPCYTQNLDELTHGPDEV